MVGFRQYVRPDIAASAIAHLSIVALVFVYAEAHPFGSVPTQSVNVDIVTSDEIEKKAEPAPRPCGASGSQGGGSRAKARASRGAVPVASAASPSTARAAAEPASGA